MSVEDRVRELVEQGDGSCSVARVVTEALELPGAPPALHQKLAAAAVGPLRGLTIEGDRVVVSAEGPEQRPTFVMAVAAPPSPTRLPPLLALAEVESEEPARVVDLAGGGWREGLRQAIDDLRGATVLALSAGTARKLLQLASSLERLEQDELPRVVALGTVARLLEVSIKSAKDVAALVGRDLPDHPKDSAEVLRLLTLHLAEKAQRSPSELEDLVAESLPVAADLSAKAFGREELDALPESPGTYLFENKDGDVIYVGKAKNLRRRVRSYFAAGADERATRVAEAAHQLTHETCGSELSALLREQELIADLAPSLNVQETVHARGRDLPPALAQARRFAVVQPSAELGAELVLVEKDRGVTVLSLLPDGPDDLQAQSTLGDAWIDLEGREENEDAQAQLELVVSWVLDHGSGASLVDADGDLDEACARLVRHAADPDLKEGRIEHR
ncbi:MAG: nucleotide excision repair endonuclease [Acidobacteriota bacterium]